VDQLSRGLTGRFSVHDKTNRRQIAVYSCTCAHLSRDIARRYCYDVLCIRKRLDVNGTFIIQCIIANPRMSLTEAKVEILKGEGPRWGPKGSGALPTFFLNSQFNFVRFDRVTTALRFPVTICTSQCIECIQGDSKIFSQILHKSHGYPQKSVVVDPPLTHLPVASSPSLEHEIYVWIKLLQHCLSDEITNAPHRYPDDVIREQTSWRSSQKGPQCKHTNELEMAVSELLRR